MLGLELIPLDGKFQHIKDILENHRKQLELLTAYQSSISSRLKLTENFVKILCMTQIGSLIGIVIILIGKYFE
jgi:hypothetical protein